MNEQAPGEGHNSDGEIDRPALIKSTCAELDRLEGERKELSDKISKLKNENIKGKLGMKIADFNITRRLYSLEGDNRDQLLATIKEGFDALGAGDQLDFIAAMERTQGPANQESDDDGYGETGQAA